MTLDESVFTPRFFDLFDAWLGEHRNISDSKQLVYAVDGITSDLEENSFDQKAVANQLRLLLHNWTEETAKEFSLKTEVDWSFSSSNREALHFVLERLAFELEHEKL